MEISPRGNTSAGQKFLEICPRPLQWGFSQPSGEVNRHLRGFRLALPIDSDNFSCMDLTAHILGAFIYNIYMAVYILLCFRFWAQSRGNLLRLQEHWSQEAGPNGKQPNTILMTRVQYSGRPTCVQNLMSIRIVQFIKEDFWTEFKK